MCNRYEVGLFVEVHTLSVKYSARWVQGLFWVLRPENWFFLDGQYVNNTLGLATFIWFSDINVVKTGRSAKPSGNCTQKGLLQKQHIYTLVTEPWTEASTPVT